MWIRIRAVIIEDEPLAAQYLAELLDETCQVEVVGSAIESEAGLRLCAELCIWSRGCDASLNNDYGNSDKKVRAVKD
jgi:DNA-binding NarL/FixJ family response regulator